MGSDAYEAEAAAKREAEKAAAAERRAEAATEAASEPENVEPTGATGDVPAEEQVNLTAPAENTPVFGDAVVETA